MMYIRNLCAGAVAMKVFFVNDSTTNPNWGDRAAAVALMSMLRESGADIVARLTEDDLLDSSFLRRDLNEAGVRSESTKTRIKSFVPPILLDIRGRLLQWASRYRSGAPVPEKWSDFDRAATGILASRLDLPSFFGAMDETDVAVINGNGAMVGTGIIPRTDLFLAYIFKRYLDIPTVIVNHTADFDNNVPKTMAANVYPLLDDVVFRDPVSVERCAEFCDGRFAPDTAFWFKPARKSGWSSLAARPTYFDVWPDSAAFNPSQSYVCLGGSSSLSRASRPQEIIQGYRTLIDQIRAVYQGQIVLTVSARTDELILRGVAAREGLPLLGLSTPVQQAIDVVGNADAYIGGRWHPSVFALGGGVPIVPLSAGTFKMRALGEMAGLTHQPVDIFSLQSSAKNVAQQFVSYLEQGDELRQRLLTWGEHMRRASWANVDSVSYTHL